MRTTIKKATASTIGLAIYALNVCATYEDCENKGLVQGWDDCAVVTFCSNHTSASTCTTGQVVWQKQHTGTVQGTYIYNKNDVCYRDVTCEWNVYCQPVLNGGGDTHNALFPIEYECE